MNGQDLRNEIEKIKYAYLIGEIDYDTAIKKVSPLVEQINTKGKIIAKKYKKKFSPITERYVLR